MSECIPAVPKKTENEVHEREGETGAQLSTALAWDGFKRIEMKHHTPLERSRATRRRGAPFYTLRVLCALLVFHSRIYIYNHSKLKITFRVCLKYISYPDLFFKN